ncbi:MAG: adenylyltransferase/cytidyltransferase family protein, partial [Bacteroidota bacterium]
MKRADLIPAKLLTAEQAKQRVAAWRLPGKKIAFTNGVFDNLHRGHSYSLSHAADEADYLIFGLNSDASV